MVPHSLSAIIITLSDRASQGKYEDISGFELETMLSKFMAEKDLGCSIQRTVIPDDTFQLKQVFHEAIANRFNFIFTTGGTGIGPRDITPDVIRPLLSKEIPGIMEVIRVRYGLQFPAAALSRSIAGVAEKSLVYCLPGNPNAVREYMEEILKTLLHCYKMMHGEGHHEEKVSVK